MLKMRYSLVDVTQVPGAKLLGEGVYGRVWKVPVSTSDDLLRLIRGGRTGSPKDEERAERYYAQLDKEDAQDVIVKFIPKMEVAEAEIKMTQEIARASMVDEWTGCRLISTYQQSSDARHFRKGFIIACVAGVVLPAFGLIVALGLQTAKIITMNQIALAGLNIGIGALNVLGASIGSVSTLSTVGAIATFALGVVLFIGVALLVARAFGPFRMATISSRLVMKPVQSEETVMDLKKYLDQRGSSLTDSDKESLARDLVDIVKYFNEDKQIGLLDLKASNFLVVQRGGHAHLMLIDAGVATQLGPGDHNHLFGTDYMRPSEAFQYGYQALQSGAISPEQRKKHDSWSMAILLFEIFSGQSMEGHHLNVMGQLATKSAMSSRMYHIALVNTVRRFAQDMPDGNPFKKYMLLCGALDSEDRKTVKEAQDAIESDRAAKVDILRRGVTGEADRDEPESIVVQASKDNFPAAASLTGGGSSAARLSEHSVTHQETTSRCNQVASSVRAKEGGVNPKDTSNHASSVRASGG